MERLTERTKYGIVENNNGVENFPLYSLYDETHLDHGLIEQCFNKLAEYEDAEEQGLLLRLPVAEGTTVYQLIKIVDYGEVGDKAQFKYYHGKTKFNRNMIDDFGKTVFLTEGQAAQKIYDIEAEQALERMGAENG